MMESPQQNRTPIVNTEAMAQRQKATTSLVDPKKINLILRKLGTINGVGIKQDYFCENENISFWNRKSEFDPKLCTISLTPEFHEGIFPVYIGKRIIFKDDRDDWKSPLFNAELIVDSVITNDADGIVLYVRKVNLFDRIFRRRFFRRGKPQIYYI